MLLWPHWLRNTSGPGDENVILLRGHWKLESRPSSSIALDHAHEQLNSEVKGEGGAAGLTEKRWMKSGPEVARMTKEFEDSAAAPKYQQ